MKLRDITVDEWERYEWTEIWSVGEPEPIYIRGVEKTTPPDDGYMYTETTRFGDARQRWSRRQTNAEMTP